MKVVDYQNTPEIELDVAKSIVGGSNTPGLNTPKLDAQTSLSNFPKTDVDVSPDIVGWTTNIVWTADNYRKVSWSAGKIYLKDGTSFDVNSGNTGNMSDITYVYADIGTPSATLQITTIPQNAVGEGKLMVCVANRVSDTGSKATFQAFGTAGSSVFITADNIASNTITANEIASNTITATQISSSYVYAGTINANNITSGTITGRTLQTGTSGQRVVINSSSNLIDFYNVDGGIAGQISGGKVGSAGVLILSAQHYVYSGQTFLTQKIQPLSNNSYNIGDSTLGYRDLYLTRYLDLKDGEGRLTSLSGHPKWSSYGSSLYNIPYVTGASTTKTAQASIKVNLGGTEFYINVAYA